MGAPILCKQHGSPVEYYIAELCFLTRDLLWKMKNVHALVIQYLPDTKGVEIS